MVTSKTCAAGLAAVGIGLAAPPAQAQPVSVHRAEQAINHWWRGAQKPRGEWCVRKRDGDICSFRTGLDKSGPFAANVSGRDTFVVWVSRTHGKVSVTGLWQRVAVTIR